MPCPGKKGKKGKKHRKHTEITSERQRRFFGAEYGRRKKGQATETDMTTADLRAHLKEVGSKVLPEKARKRKRGRKKGSKK